MKPIISINRSLDRNERWTNQLIGHLEQGSFSDGHFKGLVEIKQLGNKYRLFFSDVYFEPSLLSKKERESSDSDDSSDEIKEQPQIISSNENIQLPKLSVYITFKKPKKRIIDVQTQGLKVRLENLKDGKFGMVDQKKKSDSNDNDSVIEENEKILWNYSTPLLDVVSLIDFKGIAIVKETTEEPLTEEPIIVSFASLDFPKSIRFKSVDTLGISDLVDKIEYLLNKDVGAKKPLGAHSEKRLKSLKLYQSQAVRAFNYFKKRHDELINFDVMKEMLNYLDNFLPLTQSHRLFNAFDMNKEGKISLLDFENILIAKELLTPLTNGIILLDTYDALKSESSKIISKRIAQTYTEENGIDLSHQNDLSKITLTETARLDYSGYLEAIDFLGHKTFDLATKSDTIRESFKSSLEDSAISIDEATLTLDQFRASWLKIADLEAVMTYLNIKPEKGLFSESRNRDRLSRFLSESEKLYLDSLQNIQPFIADLKTKIRKRKDEHSREKKAIRDKLTHDLQKFLAVRSQDQRLKLKRDQEEKSKKRMEEKVLKNKLLVRQRKQDEEKRLKQLEENQKQKKLKKNEIRARGLDKLDLSVQNLKEIPLIVYKNVKDNMKNVSESAGASITATLSFMNSLNNQSRDPKGDTGATEEILMGIKDPHIRLSYLLYVDFSHNSLDILPEKDFFYWMSDLKKLKLSQNKLKVLPSELCSCSYLEILEVDSNKLSSLPSNFTKLTNLQILDLSNNNLVELPLSLGDIISLKILKLSCNKLTFLPFSICNCLSLEYLDCSHNYLEELPENFDYLISLLTLNLSCNRMKKLPDNFSNLSNLNYLDLSINFITNLPDNFSNLKKLEFCNLENNNLIVLTNFFFNFQSLKSINFKNNKLNYLDFNINILNPVTDLSEENDKNDPSVPKPVKLFNYLNITHIDLSNNLIRFLPQEIGLLKNLEVLNLSNNLLEVLNDEIFACKKLISLNISKNKFSGEVNEKFGLLHSLTFLDISYNMFTDFPENIVGCQQLKELYADANNFHKLPKNILLLLHLEVLQFSKNKFTTFPIQVHNFSQLKVVNFNNNLIDFLPQNINILCNCQKLKVFDLSYNFLKILPVEFIDILEEIEEVILDENPWTLLPNKWGKRLRNKQVTENYEGNSLSDMLNYLYAFKIIYYPSEKIWNEYAVFFHMNHLSLEDFILLLKKDLSSKYNENLNFYIEYLYFKSKELGHFPKFYTNDDENDPELINRKKLLDKKKEDNILKSIHFQKEKEKILNEVYHSNINERVLEATNKMNENKLKNKTNETISFNGLYSNIVKVQNRLAERKESDKILLENEKKLASNSHELSRLKDLIKEDLKVTKELQAHGILDKKFNKIKLKSKIIVNNSEKDYL